MFTRRCSYSFLGRRNLLKLVHPNRVRCNLTWRVPGHTQCEGDRLWGLCTQHSAPLGDVGWGKACRSSGRRTCLKKDSGSHFTVVTKTPVTAFRQLAIHWWVSPSASGPPLLPSTDGPQSHGEVRLVERQRAAVLFGRRWAPGEPSKAGGTHAGDGTYTHLSLLSERNVCRSLKNLSERSVKESSRSRMPCREQSG